MKVFWVTHGRTNQPNTHPGDGKLDTRLTPEGVKEIKHIGTDFDQCLNVYMSPAARAVETASLLFSGVYFKPDSRLVERDLGMFEGEDTLRQYERVKAFVQELETKQEDAVVVCHASTIRMALCYMFEERLEMFERFKLDTGIVFTTVYEEGYWVVEIARKYY